MFQLPHRSMRRSTKSGRLTTALLVACALFATLLALPATASAQPAGSGDGEVTVEGRGALWARGEGDVDIAMQGRFTARVAGDVTITDHAGDLMGRIRFDGEGSGDDARMAGDEAIGDMTLTGFDGEMHLRGSDFSITITNGDVGLRAAGQGEAVLIGDGVYKTRNGERMVWDGRVRLGDPQVQAA